MGKPLAAIYCRLSDEDSVKKNPGDESESIQNQRSVLFEHCMKMGWDVYQIYCDEDYSGADQSRPEWLRMLHDCENGRIDIVLCKTQSRFSREVEITEKYISNKFPSWGVRFVAPYDNIDTENTESKKARQIGGLVNEWYLDDLSANVRKTLEHKKKKGEWTGSFAPYGYETDPRDHNKLLVDQTAAYIVKDIFKMYLSGQGYIAIAKNLNDRRIPNPSVYKRSCGLKFRASSGGPTSEIWTSSTISRILRNETYTGTMVQGKRKKLDYKHPSLAVPQDKWIRVPDTHEAIIDTETWNAVQSKFAGNRSRQEKFTGCRHVLSGKVYCAECGNSMWKMSCQLSYGRYQYFKCRTVKESNTACTNNRGVRVDYLEQTVTDAINALLCELYDPGLIAVTVPKDDTDSTINILTKEKKKNLTDISKKRRAIEMMYEDVMEGRLERQESRNFIAMYTNEIRRKEERNEIIDAELGAIAPKETPQIKDVILRFSQIDELSSEVVEELVDRIVVGPDGQTSRGISIYWSV